MACAISIFSLTINPSSSQPVNAYINNGNRLYKPYDKPQVSVTNKDLIFSTSFSFHNNTSLICRASEYKFPDPIPDFADFETEKFKGHLVKKLSKKNDLFGDELDEVIGICTEIFTTFLHTEYGGPGTLLVTPFIDMADTLSERGFPGAPQAARAAVKWAQDHVDKDWKDWTNKQ